MERLKTKIIKNIYNNFNIMSYPSDKYKQSLLQIKKRFNERYISLSYKRNI